MPIERVTSPGKQVVQEHEGAEVVLSGRRQEHRDPRDRAARDAGLAQTLDAGDVVVRAVVGGVERVVDDELPIGARGPQHVVGQSVGVTNVAEHQVDRSLAPTPDQGVRVFGEQGVRRRHSELLEHHATQQATPGCGGVFGSHLVEHTVVVDSGDRHRNERVVAVADLDLSDLLGPGLHASEHGDRLSARNNRRHRSVVQIRQARSGEVP